MELNLPRTKENTTPNGKQHIFIHACREDESLLEKVSGKILSFEQGIRYCLWNAKAPEDVFSEDGKEKTGEMAVFLPLVTDHYLSLFTEKYPDLSLSGFFEELQLKGAAVLPLVERADLLPQFNRMSGEVHGIAMTLPDADRKLEDQLNRFLADSRLEERITEEAFVGRLFLSYRKKDIREARKIMKAIHDTDAACAAAIWFDDFLTAGRNFNEGIMENLKNSDAMALAVTPNVLEEGNYVREEEYKKALEYGINVLPVEAVHTDYQELKKAFPGIKPCTEMNDQGALEELLRKAGFHGPGSQSAFGEYLLGMAFFVPVNVEKDVKRAVQLFKMSAGHGCAEACEQLARLYMRGIGVSRDPEEEIRYKLRAFDLLMEQEATEENLRHLNKLLFDFNGLPLILREAGRTSKARETEEAFLERINRSPFKDQDEFILCRVNALTDLANLSYEYDLEDGGRKNADETEEQPHGFAEILGGSPGPGLSEGELNRAWQRADWASNILDKYRGEDKDMEAFLRVVIHDQYADISKYRGELKEAIRWKEKSLRQIEPLAERTGNLEYMDRSFQVSNNLGLFYYEASRTDKEARKTSLSHIDSALKKARRLEKLSPDYRTRVIFALNSRALASENAQDKKQYALECYEELLKLMKDTDISAEDAWTLKDYAIAHNIKLYTRRKDREPVYEKYYGKIPESVRNYSEPSANAGCLQLLILAVLIGCVVLQLTGAVNVTGFLRDKLGEYGVWIGAGILAILYGLTLIRRR